MKSPKNQDVTGMKWGRLTALCKDVERTKETGSTYWKFACECGTITSVQLSGVRRGDSKSCGCYSKEVARKMVIERCFKHGETGSKLTAEFRTWMNMKNRTLNPKCQFYHRYGGRGIKVCSRWKSSYLNFLEDMGRRPSEIHRIERIDNDGDYEPSNCRWATHKEQSRNTSSNRWITINGVTKILQDWCSEFGITKEGVYYRLGKGIPIDLAITLPKNGRLLAKNARIAEERRAELKKP